ncbi:MAG TPA: peptidase domain-containing ABC transporter [Balneolales bacterium]|nr:peptidase domain-containing ABC transporter [Balneolales bacterium]
MKASQRKIGIKQHDITDCGAACLASIAAHYDLKLPISRIRQFSYTDKKGTNILGMIEAATKIGFMAKGVRGQFDSLFKIPVPAIAHVKIEDVLFHFVVIYGVTKKHIRVMDPADGKLHDLPHDVFKDQWTGVLVLLVPNDGFETGNKKVSIISRLWYLMKPHRSVMIQALFGAAIFTIIGLSTAVYVQLIVDHVLPEGNGNLLNLLSIIMIGLLVLQLFIGAIKTIFTLKTGQQIDARLILGYYKHLIRLPQRFFDTMQVGEIISRINDAVKIRVFVNDVVINLAVNFFIVLFSFGLMFTYYWKLGLVMSLIIPAYGLVYVVTNQLNKKTQRSMMEQAASLESQLVESLNAISTIKQFGLEDFSNIKTETRFIRLLKSVYQSGMNSVFSGNSTQFFSRLFTIILLWCGGYYVIDGLISPGELLSFYAIIGYFTGPVGQLIGMNKTIQDAMIASDRLFEIMDLDKEQGGNRVKLAPELIGNIRFENVKFRYGSRTSVFEHLNLVIPKGRVTAFVGESGSGKTTLINILQKLYPLASGKIFIGSLNLDYIDVESLRQHISVVPQRIDLFAGNVIDNIAVGETEADMKRIISICNELGINKFIEDLPNGFETYLGENGASLSGGEKQRVAIARALYKQPEILILDEATSSLDSASEQYVHRAIKLLRSRGKTVILITHRLSSVLHADKICVLDKGLLIEEGEHEQLIEQEGHYFKLWRQQTLLPNFEC